MPYKFQKCNKKKPSLSSIPLKKIDVGVFTPHEKGGILSSCQRKGGFPDIHLPLAQCKNLKVGDIVTFFLQSPTEIRVLSCLGQQGNPHILNEIALHHFNIPVEFSPSSLEIAEKGNIPLLGDRKDYRGVTLVTIDGEDARDFDDAVWAEADCDPKNKGGWRVIVAIADVSFYVPVGSPLDREAYERGNSVYFPDRVTPMLPEVLSTHLCSLRPDEDRACLAMEMRITSKGQIKSHKVRRGLMRSRARLTYTQVQNALQGTFDPVTSLLYDSVIHPLHGVYQSLLKARKKRNALDLDMPERQIIFDEKGQVQDIVIKKRLDSHKIIEELMIAANIAAAHILILKKWPCLFRVHDQPDKIRVDNLRHTLKKINISKHSLGKWQNTSFNTVLQDIKGHPSERLIHELVLRSQAQAKYSPKNQGHFGLGLSHYAHFTSPIRRYSDLIIHRCLIGALELGQDGYSTPPQLLMEWGDHLSQRERLASQAERDVFERLTISHVSSKVGKVFEVTIVGINKVGLFVEIPKSGAQGFIPKHTFGASFYFDEKNHCFLDRGRKTSLQLGGKVKAFLVEADEVKQILSFRLIHC